MGLDVTIRRIESWVDRLDLDEFVMRSRQELNRTQFEAVDLAEQLYDYPNTLTWIVRDHHDVLIGFVALHRGRKKSDAHTASLRIHIYPGMRGQGLGRDLLTVALAGAEAAGITRITATPYIKGGLGLYSSIFELHGFVKEGVMRGAVRQGDELYDVALLARLT